jgi:hypothetical protein
MPNKYALKIKLTSDASLSPKLLDIANPGILSYLTHTLAGPIGILL